MNKLTEKLGHPPKTIAIFRAIKLGDLLCAVPAFRALRSAFPQAHIALISLPWAAEFVNNYADYFDEFIPFPGWPGLPEQPFNPERTLQFLQQMQRRQWDVVVQMQGNGTLVNSMVHLFGATLVAGYYPADLPSEQWAAQSGLFQPYPTCGHEVCRHVDLMTFLGIPSQGYDLEFRANEVDQLTAQQLLIANDLLNKPYVCIHPGGISGRRWSAHHFAKVADWLSSQGYPVVLTGTTAEQSVIDSVRDQMLHPVLSLAGQTNLGVLGSILQRAALLVSNDTGVAHLGTACETPSVIIFTTASPSEWGPLRTDRHRIVQESTTSGVDQVLAEVSHLLAGERSILA
jgi:ADP-heptose:LPS heptosyltransferase